MPLDFLIPKYMPLRIFIPNYMPIKLNSIKVKQGWCTIGITWIERMAMLDFK